MKRSGRKYKHYFETYEVFFRNMLPKKILEIGVQSGGSLLYWRSMFPKAEILGVDIDRGCMSHENPKDNIYIKIGDQENVEFLKSLGESFDLIIDDGGHTVKQQLVSFETLFPVLNPGGMYVIEDLHTSYYPDFGGNSGAFTTISFLKSLVDDVNANYVTKESRYDSNYKISNRFGIENICFVESMCFIKKQQGNKDYSL